MGKRFVKTILGRPVTVILIIFALVVFGVSALTGMPLEYMPDIEMPMEIVMITWPRADADSIDRLVAQPVEDACETISNIESVNSYVYDNYTMVQLTFQYGTDMDEAYSGTKVTLDNLMPDLPDGCTDPVIVELSADYVPTMMISATAPAGMDVTSYLNENLVPSLKAVGGVAMVDVTGTREEYIRIVLNEAALRQYGLSIAAVGNAIAAADFDMPVGSVTMGTQDIALGVYGNVDVDMDFRDLPIQTPYGKTVRLDEVCTYFGTYRKEADTVSRYNGNDSVMLQITKQDSASTITVCRDVMNTLRRCEADGVTFRVIYSDAESIIKTLGEVLRTLIISVVLTMLVLFVFFGDWRSSLVVAISMPLSILLAVILLNWAGYAIDLMTGSALIIAIGMIVDNSIVILESCMRCREEGLELKEAAAEGTATMLMSIVAGTLTTVVVYIPLALSKGMVGMLFAPLSWTILLTMLSSLLSAIMVVPLAFIWLKPKSREKLVTNRVLDRLRGFYRRVMPRLLRHPGRVVLVGVLSFVAAIVLMTRMEFVMMPSDYNGSITVNATFRSGTKLEVMDQRVTQIEQALLEDENFEDVTLSISNNTAKFTAYAVKNCKRSSEAAVEEYTLRFNTIPGMDVTVAPSSGSSNSNFMSTGNSKSVTLTGDDMASLEKGAAMVQTAMEETPGVIRVENPFSRSRVKGKIVVNSQRAQAAGTSEASVAMQIYYVLNGMTATTVDYDGSEYDVILETPQGKYDDITALLDYPIATQTGRQIAVRDIADVEYISSLPTITRQAGKYAVTLTATTTASAKYTAAREVDAAVARLELPQGVSQGTSMTDDIRNTEVKNGVTALVTAIFLVFLVMAIQFNSPRLSIMVMMCIPLSLVGSILLIFLTGRPLSLIGLMGFLMLSGIAVNNGIYLIDGTDQLRKTLPLQDALVTAGTTRLRPILMTTLTTIISMLPMIFSGNSGIGMTTDMGYVIIGGLVASTILAMFLMPAFYLLIRRERLDGTRRGRKGRRAATAAAEDQAEEAPLL